MILVVKFACFNLAVELYLVNLLNAWAVINLSWSWSVIFVLISLIFALKLAFKLKLTNYQ